MIKVPNGYKEIIAEFGDPTDPHNPGHVNAAWQAANIKVIPPPAGWQLYYQPTGKKIKGIQIHIKLADSFTAVLTEIWEHAKSQLPGTPTDDDIRQWLHGQNLDQTDGGFNYRPSSGNSKVLSLHSFGIAIDWDAKHNPHKKPMEHTLPDWWYEIWAKHGWSNGKHFKTLDPMHVQYATGA